MKLVTTESRSLSPEDVWESLGSDGFFQNPTLGDLYAETTRHKVLRFVASAGQSSIGYTQVVVFREGPEFLGSIGAHGTIRHGPLMKPGALESDWAALLRKVEGATRGSLAYLRVYPGRISPPRSIFLRERFERQSWVNFYVDLKRPEKTILAGMRKERRYGIRKASERGVVVSIAESSEDIEEAYTLLLDTHKRARFPLEPRSFFVKAFDKFYPKHLQVFIGRLGHRAFATSVVVLEGNSAVNWYAGSVNSGAARKLYPNDAVLWEAIRWSQARGLASFDMGGGGPPGQTGGFVSFKREFGGDEVDVGHYTYVPQPWKYGMATIGFNLIRKIRWLGR